MWRELLSEALHIVLVIAAPIVLTYAVRALQALHARAGVQLSQAQLDAVQRLARLAVASTEEWAATLLKTRGEAPGSADKLTRALSIVAGQFPTMPAVDLEHVIHAEIAGLPNVGATGAAVVRAGDTLPPAPLDPGQTAPPPAGYPVLDTGPKP